ncbi:hypothetical protein [Modestobacter sp. Leaf380]|uniref:WapI family immunity protein n=1 Tax=Modestobacter sp. Leaf380 TaxID=1736356 RepID=UPI0006F5E4B2|nr:hypothetical protein [Modestobacter sp. Leaf380]KQS71538.1 hypothetical protein ASG41_19925 [Modestobacter sp. Leaf380]
MRLTSWDGAWLDLRVLRRQALELRAVELDRPDWSETWVVVRGEVRTTDGRHWVFREPCLTPWEAQRLGSWLRAVGEAPDGLVGEGLVFREPELSFVLDAAREDRRLLRAHLAGSAAWADPVSGRLLGGGVPLDVTAEDLALAAHEWTREVEDSA